MKENIVIIGAVALGPKAACRCKRLNPDANVTLIDENSYISYGGCGMPYFVSGEVQTFDILRSTPYQRIRDPEFFKEMKDVKVLTNTKALSIDRKNKTVLVKNLNSNAEETLNYDKLVLATGAKARIPNIEGINLNNVYSLTSPDEAIKIRNACEQGKFNSAVIVGAGFIGLEVAVALSDMWGIKTTIIEMASQALPGVISHAMSHMVSNDCKKHDVTIYTNEKVLKLDGKDTNVNKVITDKREIEAQLVILAAGFIPNISLAEEAGLKTDYGIIVNEHLQTSDPDIYAGGDCVLTKNLITEKLGYLPMGSLANRQGRVIGTNLAGGNDIFKGHVGTWALKLFDLNFCGTGLSLAKAQKEGFDAISVSIEQHDNAHFYPEKTMTGLELVVDKKSSRILGIQGVSANGASLKARIDAIAATLFCSKPTVKDISCLEIAYAPPFASAMDVINTVANVADNVLNGHLKQIMGDEFMQLWKDRDKNDIFFIDTRPEKAGEKVQEKYSDWHSISLEKIVDKINEIPKDKTIALVCNTGLRAYESLLILKKHGINNIIHVAGGMQAIIKMGLEP